MYEKSEVTQEDWEEMEVFKTQFLMSAAVIFHFLLVRLKRKGQIGLGNEVPQTLRPLCRE